MDKAGDSTTDSELDELLSLTRQLRGQIQRRIAHGGWAAPGSPTAQIAFAEPAPDLGEPETESVPQMLAEVGAAALRAPLPEIDLPLVPLGRRTLAEVRADLGECTRCKLHATRKSIVFGVGAEDAPLMFVGEAPGEQEDRRGEPFVGRAGELLDKMIEAMGWTRQAVYIGNTLKCLRYNAPVQLGDGSWERIGRLVRNHYEGTVRSIDPDGRIANKRVIGWHATPLGDRRVFRLSYSSAKSAGASRVAIQLTGDHEVLTDRGFVAVESLPLGAQIATGHGLSEVATEVVFGTLLGDGHIARKSSSLTFSHSEDQEEYALFKAALLQELGCADAHFSVAVGDRGTYPVVQIRTLAHRTLRLIRKRFYGTVKRVPAELRTRLTVRMLAVWFLDDGYLRKRPPRRPHAEIATCSFSPADIQVLLDGLRSLGLEAYTLRNRIYFNVDQTQRLSELIAPFVPPSMRYKLCPEVEARIPFDPTRWIGKPATVTYDTAIVEPMEHVGTDKTFFCIDVEDNHNFVTTGGVVHNCRPPGNRNPAPDELGHCMPFLKAQITAVAPRIIVALGRPAANQLLGTDAPISALRGKFHDRFGTKVMPTFHPAYLLREPDRKRDTWADLKLVIAELQRIGIRPPNDPRP